MDRKGSIRNSTQSIASVGSSMNQQLMESYLDGEDIRVNDQSPAAVSKVATKKKVKPS